MNNTSVSDDELIPRLLAKEESAYILAVKTYHGIMVHLARNIVGDAIADEVAQEAWLAVLKALPKFERRSSLKTWILRIVSNCAKTRLRHESRTVNYADLGTESDNMISASHFNQQGRWQNPPSVWQHDTPDALLANEQLRQCIDSALNDLPPLQKAALTLREIQGLDMESICKILEVSESNGRVLIHRARSQIRVAIDEFQRNDE